MAEANSGEAGRCLDIARRALASEDYDRATRFAEKALRLYPSDQARASMAAVGRNHDALSAKRMTPQCSPARERRGAIVPVFCCTCHHHDTPR